MIDENRFIAHNGQIFGEAHVYAVRWDVVDTWVIDGIKDAAQWIAAHPDAQWFGVIGDDIKAAFPNAGQARLWVTVNAIAHQEDVL